jgi:hypothetical protein
MKNIQKLFRGGQRGGIGPLGGLSMKTDTTLSRRRLLVGVPAVAAAGVPSVATALGGLVIGDDAKLLALVDEYFAADAEYDRLSAAETELSTKHYASVPTPDALRVRPEDETLGILTSDQRYRFAEEIIAKTVPSAPKTQRPPPDTYDHMSVDGLRKPKWPVVIKLDFPPDIEPWSAGGFVGTRYVEPSPAARKRADEIIAAYDDWTKACELPESSAMAYDAAEAALNDVNDLLSEIEDEPALTFASLAAKTRVALAEFKPEENDGPTLIWSVVEDLAAIAEAQH